MGIFLLKDISKFLNLCVKQQEKRAMVQPEYKEWKKDAKSHLLDVIVKRWRAANEWESGNKWFKLKYNVLHMEDSGYKGWVSIGGPWSNHLVAMSYAGQQLLIPGVGLIRGEWRMQSPTAAMIEMERNGMELQGLDVSLYEWRDSEDFKVWIRDQFPGYYFIPEGGSNYWGLMGAMEMIDEYDRNSFDHIWVAGGTGTTGAGILLASNPQQKVHVVFALKAPEYELREMVRSKLKWVISQDDLINDFMDRLQVYSEDRWGGYGKGGQELFDFIDRSAQAGLEWDRVYTGKMAWMIDQQWVNLEHRNLIIHTGGLQGNRSITSS